MGSRERRDPRVHSYGPHVNSLLPGFHKTYGQEVRDDTHHPDNIINHLGLNDVNLKIHLAAAEYTLRFKPT